MNLITEDYDKIMSDRNLFNKTVYTPLSEAIKILEERQKDHELKAKIEKLLKGDIPEFFKKNKKCGVIGRHIATPNYENRLFIKIAEENNLHPVFFEYHDDKFTPNCNYYKHSLGQLSIKSKKLNKKGEFIIEKITIVDFNKYNGKKLKDVVTLWEEPLIKFHRKLLNSCNYDSKDFCLYDGSDWYKNNGSRADVYYEKFFLLFICFGILFENYLVSKDEEGNFTKNIVLPAMKKAIKITGFKPLIVPIPPMEMENEGFWYYHLPEVRKYIIK